MLTSILSACVLCAVAQALMPKGPIRQVGALVCGLVLLCALLAPVARLRLEANAEWLEQYLGEVGQSKKELEDTVRREWKTVIEENCSAYIADKAAELGLNCSVCVSCRDTQEGTYIPVSVVISGVPEGEERDALTRYLAQEWNVIATYTQEAAE